MSIICEFHFHVDARKIQLEPKNNKITTDYNFPNATCFNKKKFVKKLQKFVEFHSFQSGLFLYVPNKVFPLYFSVGIRQILQLLLVLQISW